MKKLSTLFMVLVLACGLSMIGCKKAPDATTEEVAPTTEAPAEAPAEEAK